MPNQFEYDGSTVSLITLFELHEIGIVGYLGSTYGLEEALEILTLLLVEENMS
jgi:hypothetical protein